jgi:hypothetical protein
MRDTGARTSLRAKPTPCASIDASDRLLQISSVLRARESAWSTLSGSSASSMLSSPWLSEISHARFASQARVIS